MLEVMKKNAIFVISIFKKLAIGRSMHCKTGSMKLAIIPDLILKCCRLVDSMSLGIFLWIWLSSRCICSMHGRLSSYFLALVNPRSIITLIFSMILSTVLLSSLWCTQALAVVTARPIGNESRIKIITYIPNSVVLFVGHYTFHSIIEFSPDEEIKTITMGTPTSWQIYPDGNRIFIKPIAEDATTNMTVITSKRMYFFEMHAEYADSINDRNIAFITKFMYPDAQGMAGQQGINNPGGTMQNFIPPDLSKPEQYNFNYKISGKSRRLEPVLIFDDGEFTYFRFRNVNAELPAFYTVGQDGDESMVNYRIFAGYVVVERVSDRFTLRSGKETICVFNEAFNAATGQSFVDDIAQQNVKISAENTKRDAKPADPKKADSKK